MQKSPTDVIVSLGRLPGRTAGSSMFNCLRNLRTVFHGVAPAYVSFTGAQQFPSLHVLLTIKLEEKITLALLLKSEAGLAHSVFGCR